ncbi:MAG: class I SAM-dependent methyltransferase [Firmicutes bacterium]|nr:class I SAM-dependent methyltransferase [Bacillota bacterium]
MNIAEQFNIISKDYDSGRRKFIPCFEAYYKETTNFIANSISEPSKVLDLGAGTGLLTSFWFQHFPDAQYILTDVAEEMLNIAKSRFAGINNVKFEVSDYKNGLPAGNFDVIMSALSIHHLEDKEKELLFKLIYDKLPVGGIFLNYDQFCGDNSDISHMYDAYWIDYLKSNGLSADEIEKWEKRRLLDRECSVPTEIEMLKKAGFVIAECIFSMQKFSVIAAIKKI